MLQFTQYTHYFGNAAYIFMFFVGLIFGSFLNSIIWRLWDNIAIFSTSRSVCVHCRHQLSWKENIPLLSWLVLKGRCAHCRKNISVYYPLVELAVAVCFTAV
ncbi:MAG: prepilin peptidase, partial [Candidatus Magasanikbacteria bacterium]|nr:prepilin peptidase [Candidatus Magasanikbacteria bacterium]